jgi:regulator of replication initiation timing
MSETRLKPKDLSQLDREFSAKEAAIEKVAEDPAVEAELERILRLLDEKSPDSIRNEKNVRVLKRTIYKTSEVIEFIKSRLNQEGIRISESSVFLTTSNGKEEEFLFPLSYLKEIDSDYLEELDIEGLGINGVSIMASDNLSDLTDILKNHFNNASVL